MQEINFSRVSFFGEILIISFQSHFNYFSIYSNSKMAGFQYVRAYLGYGGEGQPLGPVIDHERTGQQMPPTYREILEYGLHLSSTFENGNYPLKKLIK